MTPTTVAYIAHSVNMMDANYIYLDLLTTDLLRACGWVRVQILGFDILLKSDGMPMLLEVNASPSMRLDCEQEVSPGVVEVVSSPVDEEIKKALVLDTLLLVAPRFRTLSSPSPASSAAAPAGTATVSRYNALSCQLLLLSC